MEKSSKAACTLFEMHVADKWTVLIVHAPLQIRPGSASCARCSDRTLPRGRPPEYDDNRVPPNAVCLPVKWSGRCGDGPELTDFAAVAFEMGIW